MDRGSEWAFDPQENEPEKEARIVEEFTPSGFAFELMDEDLREKINASRKRVETQAKIPGRKSMVALESYIRDVDACICRLVSIMCGTIEDMQQRLDQQEDKVQDLEQMMARRISENEQLEAMVEKCEQLWSDIEGQVITCAAEVGQMLAKLECL